MLRIFRCKDVERTSPVSSVHICQSVILHINKSLHVYS